MHYLLRSSGISSPRLLIPILGIGFMVLEYLLSRLVHHDEETHDLRESASSLVVSTIHHLLKPLESGIAALPFTFAYDHRLLHFSATDPLAIVSLFLATEFMYYWQHRLSHSIRWMWATHAVHHSPTRLNLTAAVRLGWTGNISGNFLFFIPLAWVGFHPLAILVMLALNLFYQFFIHTELSPRLGPLEWVLNTPAHHRVHHASNEACLDKNFGGVLIVFDRLFHTFAEAPSDEKLRYGLKGGEPTLNPLRIAFGEWATLIRDMWNAPTILDKVLVCWAAPGSQPRWRSENLGMMPKCVPGTQSQEKQPS
ncbi:MAG TPA: sterol desaturase family protein [Bradyrhizobium sp.]|nr:sterol desaturase family protein [Bradyrhizobium sp.]